MRIKILLIMFILQIFMCMRHEEYDPYAVDSVTAMGNEEIVKTLSEINKYHHITHMHLYDCDTSADFTLVQYCKTLEILSLWLLDSIRNIHVIANLENLKWLTFHECADLNTVSFLSQMNGLTALSLEGLPSLTNVDSIYALSNLEHLRINLNDTIEQINAISNLRNLETLGLNNLNKITAFPDLSGLDKLRWAYLYNLTELIDISGFNGMDGLCTLYISGCDSLESLAGVDNLNNLEYLYLGNGKISDISSIAGLTSLEKLEMYYERITDLSPIASLSKLKTLRYVTFLSSIDFTPLAELRSIRKLTLSYGSSNPSDLTPLLSCLDTGDTLKIPLIKLTDAIHDSLTNKGVIIIEWDNNSSSFSGPVGINTQGNNQNIF